MALNRRNFMLAVPACALTGCVSSANSPGPVQRYRELAATAPRASARGTVLVCMPETKQTKEVWTGLYDELERDFNLVAVNIEGRTGARAIAEGVQRHQPSGVVLMNNPTVLAYREFQHSVPNSPPAVIVMTSFLDGNPRNVNRATGISYEVPLITVVTNLRRLIASPIERVGVVLRSPLRGFVQRQAELARQEQTQVVFEQVGMEPNPAELRRALRRLKQRSHAIWVLNDDRLLTPRLISDGWLPEINERPFSPAIVGAASLVSPSQSFGTFAVLPDHTALGAQAASMLFDLADNRWALDDTRVQLPLSTTTTVDLTQVRERFALRKDALAMIDHILE
jgi:hypothetical protein